MQGVVATEIPFRHVMKLAQSGSAGFAIMPDFEGAQGSAIDDYTFFSFRRNFYDTIFL